jgi:NAD(P)-dependent dehydrogenase (short-subunit alcohol dehydrogenase family)
LVAHGRQQKIRWTPQEFPLPGDASGTDESAKLAKFFSSAVPQGRWGEPEEVAKAVLFLASDDSSYVNSVELMVDGGATGAPFGAPILRG